MDGWKPQRRLAYADIVDALRPHAALALFTLLAAIPLLLIASLTPAPLVLPVFSIIFLAFAGLVALFAWQTSAVRHSRTVTSWDVAGAFAFVGFAAAILSKPENILLAFAGATAG
ncbi:MAG: hypothetical protein GEU91_14285 [Rhizobiales bacterium]|nr:hypothetical protein [Hyphomicrobiales bacterium]